MDKPIPSPYQFNKDEISDLPEELLNKIKALVESYGYIDVFISAHGKTSSGKCYWTGSSSIQSDCLKNFLENVVRSMDII